MNLKYKGIEAIYGFDPDAKSFSGASCNTRDVITFQATSVECVEQAFRDSVDDYIELCKSRGEEPNIIFSTGSDNVFEDLGFVNADEMLVKSELRRRLEGLAPKTEEDNDRLLTVALEILDKDDASSIEGKFLDLIVALIEKFEEDHYASTLEAKRRLQTLRDRRVRG